MNPGRVEPEGNTFIEDLKGRLCTFHPGQGLAFFIQDVNRARPDSQERIEGLYGEFILLKVE